jgi:hypothetical protein
MQFPQTGGALLADIQRGKSMPQQLGRLVALHQDWL